MLAGLRFFFGPLTIALCIYSLSTENFALIPYMQLSLTCMFILLGITEIKAARKTMGVSYFFLSALMFFIMISKFFH